MDYQLHTRFATLEPLREDWNALLTKSIVNTPFLRYEYLKAWWQLRGGGEWPPESQLRVVVGRKAGKICGIAPLFQVGEEILLLGSEAISDFLDLIVAEANLQEFLDGLWHTLPDWQRLNWANVLETSPTRRALAQCAAAHGWTFSDQVLQPAPYIPLPGDFETYLAGLKKKQRHEIRRKLRRAARQEAPVRWYILSDADDLDEAIEACFQLMSQDPEKQAFLTHTMRSQMRSLLHAAFQAGWLQLAFLEVGGRKAAGYLNFDYNNRIWVYNSGAHPDFLHLSPGWVLLGHLLQWANENGRHEFDFMRGDETYKYRFGAVNRYVHRLQIKK